MRSGNPALKDSTFLDLSRGTTTTVIGGDSQVMTLNGTVNKTGILLLLTVLTAAYSWSQVDFGAGAQPGGAFNLYLWGGLIAGLVFALATIVKKEWAPVTAPLYAISEGFFLGAISAMYSYLYEGIVQQAVMLTFATLFAMLMAYRSGLIKPTEKFRAGVVAATGGIALVYLATIVLRFFDIQIPLIHESGLIGIGSIWCWILISSKPGWNSARPSIWNGTAGSRCW